MFVAMPVLIVLGLAMLGLIVMLLSRRGGRGDDLMRPPPMLTAAPTAAAIASAHITAPLATAPETTEEASAEQVRLLLVEVRKLLTRGRKIEAVKLVRDHMSGLGLKEAKDWVEAVERGGG